MKPTWRDYVVAAGLAILLCIAFAAVRRLNPGGTLILGGSLGIGMFIGAALGGVILAAKKAVWLFPCIGIFLLAWLLVPMSVERIPSICLGAGVVSCLMLTPWIATKIATPFAGRKNK